MVNEKKIEKDKKRLEMKLNIHEFDTVENVIIDTLKQAFNKYYIESFINDTLRHRGNRQGDICYVVFQKNGYNLIYKERARTDSQGWADRKHFHKGIKKTVTMYGGTNKTFYSYKQQDTYVKMLPRFIIYKLTNRPAPTNPSILRFQLEYINNVPQIWEETSYLNQNITLPSPPTS